MESDKGQRELEQHNKDCLFETDVSALLFGTFTL